MDEKSARSIYESEIESQVNTLLPYGAGPVTDHRLRHAFDMVAKTAFRQGESFALLSLMTIDDVLMEINRRLVNDDRKPISKRRLQAIARTQHDRWGVGYQVPGTNQWLFRPLEMDSLMPGDVGRPRKKAVDKQVEK